MLGYRGFIQPDYRFKFNSVEIGVFKEGYSLGTSDVAVIDSLDEFERKNHVIPNFQGGPYRTILTCSGLKRDEIIRLAEVLIKGEQKLGRSYNPWYVYRDSVCEQHLGMRILVGRENRDYLTNVGATIEDALNYVSKDLIS